LYYKPNIMPFDKFKRSYGRKQLDKTAVRQHEAIASSYRSAQSFGILCDATHEEHFKIVRALMCKLKADGKEVILLGYVDKLHLEDFHIQPQEFRFFCKKDLNWYYKPTDNGAINFAQKPFDILIDLSVEEFIPLRFVLRESMAGFKIGRYNPSMTADYDMMIHIDNNNIELLFEQCIHYLKMMNKNK